MSDETPKRHAQKAATSTDARFSYVEGELDRLYNVTASQSHTLEGMMKSLNDVTSTLAVHTQTSHEQSLKLTVIHQALVRDQFNANDDGVIGQSRQARLDLDNHKSRIALLEQDMAILKASLAKIAPAFEELTSQIKDAKGRRLTWLNAMGLAAAGGMLSQVFNFVAAALLHGVHP
jgi:chromosome segregation ATPase